MHDAAATPLLAPLRPDERYATWHLALADGSLVGAGTGLVELARSLHLTRSVAGVLAALPDSLLESLYSVVARHRGLLGRVVPNGPGPRRFP
jgi:predicted DCC family thiol-disulfide oxidoreductase YuxK